MNEYLEYEKILRGQIGALVFVLVLIIISFIVLIFVNKKAFSEEDMSKFGRFMINVVIVAVFLIFSFIDIYDIYKFNKDIKSQAYVTYYGEFNVSEYKEGYVSFEYQGKSITLSGCCYLPGGDYFGTIVYSRSSEHLLDWEVDNQKLDGNGY